MFASRADRDAEVKRLEDTPPSISLPIIWVFKVKQGQIGSLDDPSQHLCSNGVINGLVIRPLYHTMQLIDTKTALILATYDVASGNGSARFFLVSPRVADLQEDGEFYSFPGVFRVSGTRKYTTTAGASSVIPVVESYELPRRPKVKKQGK